MSQITAQASLPPWLAAQQAQLLASPGHALLLHGPSGLGQYELALSLVAAWLCEGEGRVQPSEQKQEQEGGLFEEEPSAPSLAPSLAPTPAAFQPACGQCPSCQQIEARSHTDLTVLMPEALMIELGWPLSEKAQKEIDDKKRKPSREIRIDDVREAVAFAELTSGRGQGKAILVYPAEALNTASANALLKTLEEPAGQLRFALATEAAHQLLPTIRSRCQAFALRWPSPDESMAWLQNQQPKATTVQLETALQASGGRPLDALDLIAAGADTIWAGLPKAMQKGRVDLVAQWPASQLLDALLKLCHDLWAIKLDAAPRFFAAQDLPKPPPSRALAAWGEQLKALARSIEHTWKADLLLEDMVNQAKVCLNSRS
jgi:DNA polymerase III subunit delta'